MFAHLVPTMAQTSASPTAEISITSRSLSIALRAAVMAVEGVLIAAVVMIVGHLLGDWFGIAHPSDPRTPGGPTPADIEAFTAIGAIIVGLGLTAWRVTHGSLTIFAGAFVFGLTLPDLTPMAVIFGMIGVINLGAWLVKLARENHLAHGHHDGGDISTRPPHRSHDRPRHMIGLV